MWGVLTLEDVEVSPASLDLVIFPLFLCSASSFLTNRSVDLLCVGFLLSHVGVLFHRNFVVGLMGLGLDNMGLFVVMFLGSLAQLQLQ